MIQYLPTELPDVWHLLPEKYGDARGYFTELLRFPEFYDRMPCQPFVQENESLSSRGVLRGMHLQRGDAAQAKLVRAVYGRVLDVVVDLRYSSPTFGRYVAVVLDGEQKNMLFVPRGFAHGFLTLSEQALFNYKVDNVYAPNTEISISPFDDEMAIPWVQLAIQHASPLETPLSREQFILSDKDIKGISLSDFRQQNINH